MDDTTRCILNSWILYSLRELLGLQVVRNRILKPIYSENPNIVIGKTFGYGSTYTELEKYVKTLLNNKTEKLYLFTSSNLLYDFELGLFDEFETHYQTFVLDKKNKTLYTYDPSYDLLKDKSLYKALASKFLTDIVEKYGYSVYKIFPGIPMQVSTNDVFCQTWSLMVQGRLGIEPGTFEMDVPWFSFIKTESDRYKILLEFYKAVLSNKLNCKNFKEIFYENVTEQSIEIKSINPCKYVIEEMNYKDFNPC